MIKIALFSGILYRNIYKCCSAVRRMKKNIISVFGIFLFAVQIHAQHRVSGFVKDSVSGERLIGATIFDADSKSGTVSDQTGFFSLIVKPSATLILSFMGYENQQIIVNTATDNLLQIAMKPSSKILEGAEIMAFRRPTFQIAKLNSAEILSIPNLVGKPDVLKALQFLPGIRSGNEATSVTLVRGGNQGENLYLLDNTPLIYVHHIGGHLSVFNPDMINDIEVYKGGFPAKYGEKLSSIMNISQKSGNKQAFQGSYSVGITDLALTLEGPTKLENSSFIITARKTLIDLYYLLATGISEMSGAYLMYGFHDINGKYTWSPDPRNTLAVNFYHGDDYLQMFSKKADADFGGRFRKGNTWGNVLASVNWNHVSPSDLMLKNTLSFTRYRLRDVIKLTYKTENIEEGMTNRKEQINSSMQDLSWRSDASYALKKNWDLDFGLKLSYLRFKPMMFSHSKTEIPDFKDVINTFEPAVYVSSQIKPLDFIDIEVGLRGVGYMHSRFANFSIEPRLNANLYLNPNHSFNLSAMRVTQNAQLITNIGSLTANEIYVPSGTDIPVSFSNQFSAGYQAVFSKQTYALEANVYYKKLKDLTTYKDGFGYAMGDIYWRDKLISGGTGLAQGFEVLFKKNKGKFTGFLGYTYSKSTRRFDGINHGQTYAFEYDSPHDLSIHIAYQISEKWSFGTTWIYQSGLPFTPAIGRYQAIVPDNDGNNAQKEVLIYGDKNSARMHAYHRLDIAFKKKIYTKKQRRKAEWTFGIYNLYNRQNPYFYYYGTDKYGSMLQYGDTYKPIKLYQISMFSFIPMISYKAWFGAGSKQW